MNNDNIKLLFGLKIKQLRIDKKIGQQELAIKSGLSVSYINEIEKGKKYPKADKITALANAFGIEYDEMVSLKLSKNLAPLSSLLNSNFLKDFPIDIFGINPSELLELMSDKPTKLGAFVNTIIEIGRSYNMTVEDFYIAVLRSYQEMHNNYFQDIEDTITDFLKAQNIPYNQIIDEEFLTNFIQTKHKIDILYFDEKTHPNLSTLRSVMIPKKNVLMLNKNISSDQRSFTLGREIGFIEMKIKVRPLTSSWVAIDNFEQIFNNFRASYFSVGVLIQRQHLSEKLKEIFEQKVFEIESLTRLADYFKATPETFFHQMAKVMMQEFGVDDLFFLRFDNNFNQETYYLTKEIHISPQYAPNGIVDEHYCRRWKAIDILKELKELQIEKKYTNPIGGIQISNFYQTDNNYLTFSMARPLNINKDINTSVSIGIKINEKIKSKLLFLDDPSISKKTINRTCERCAIFDCKERVASPKILQKRRRNQELTKLIDELCN